MKRKIYLFFTAAIIFLLLSIKSYSQSLARPATIIYKKGVARNFIVEQKTLSQTGNQFFQNFAGGINTLFNKNGTGISFDLSSYTVHWFIVLGQKQSSVTFKKNDGTSVAGTETKYKGFDIYVINRAAINFDSLKAIANDYLTSLQASPFTLRFDKTFFLTKNEEISEEKATPVAYFKITGDARGVPYSDPGGKVNIGASGNLFATLSTQFKTYQINDDGTIGNKGTIYIEPSVGFAYGTDSLMQTVFTDAKNRWLVTSELRLGFTSDNNKVSDWGFILRYSFSDIIGPKFRAGIAFSPN